MERAPSGGRTRSRRRRLAGAAATMAVVGLLVGCADQAPGADSGGVPAGDAAASTLPVALDFTAPLVGGGVFDGSEFTERPVVFWFWAPT